MCNAIGRGLKGAATVGWTSDRIEAATSFALPPS